MRFIFFYMECILNINPLNKIKSKDSSGKGPLNRFLLRKKVNIIGDMYYF